MSDEIVLVPENTLLTENPEQGRALAIKLARLTVKATQPDAAVRDKLRSAYAESADSLLSAVQIVSTEFATIAAANNYWR